jgi:hypothetical protein
MLSTANSVILLSLTCLIGFSIAQVADQVRVENFPLSFASPVNCDDIVQSHTFEGTCCALNTTAGDGCVLNVVNGQCVVRKVYLGDLMCNDQMFEECVILIHGPVHFSLQVKGQYFTLDYTSTMSNEPCPPGEYTSDDLGIEGPPTMAPLNAEETPTMAPFNADDTVSPSQSTGPPSMAPLNTDGTVSLSKSTGLLLSLLASLAFVVS